jgi:hypothetical protein
VSVELKCGNPHGYWCFERLIFKQNSLARTPAEAHPGAALALPGGASREAAIAKTRIPSAHFWNQ